jgi:hypothetical protein
MYYRFYDENTYEINPTWETIWEDRNDYKKIIPAWSLHRLILLCKYNDDDFGTLIPREGTYDYLIESIAYRIKEGYFNNDYLI